MMLRVQHLWWSVRTHIVAWLTGNCPKPQLSCLDCHMLYSKRPLGCPLKGRQ